MKRILFLTLSVLISGCGSTPYSKEIWAEPGQVKIGNEKERQKVSYLARYLMPKDEALKLDKDIRNSEWINDATLKTAASFTGSLLQTGNPFSTAGVNAAGNLTTALTVASWLLPEDGIMENISGIYLPGVWKGKAIETQEQAKIIAINHTESQLRKTAERYNLNYECIASCESMMSRVYLLGLTPETDFSHLVYQAPGGIYVTTHWFDLSRPEHLNSVENAALGFNIGWQTPPGNTWLVNFYGTPLLNDEGEVVISEGENGYIYPSVRHKLNYTELGRMLYKTFNDDGGYLFMGSEDQVPRMVAYNGKLYSYISRRAKRFIDRELVEEIPE